jgi:hypothetical protein
MFKKGAFNGSTISYQPSFSHNRPILNSRVNHDSFAQSNHQNSFGVVRQRKKQVGSGGRISSKNRKFLSQLGLRVGKVCKKRRKGRKH